MERNDRYLRHYTLKGFGQAAQEKLLQAKVLVVGAGGLGCPALQYLAAAGVGKLGIVDYDRIEIHNLQRQILFNSTEIGLPKADTAAAKLKLLNPEIEVHAYCLKLSTDNAITLLEGYDIILDCSDNFALRYLLCDLCMLLEKPLVFAAVYQYEGQLAVFNVADIKGHKTTYRHLFPTPPDPLEAPDCNNAGVLGVLPGILGTMQATEAIKLISGVGQALSNKLMTINLLNNSSLTLDIKVTLAEGDIGPSNLAEFESFDYPAHCGISHLTIKTIAAQDLYMLQGTADTLIVDVRDRDELPSLPFAHLRLPLAELPHQLHSIRQENVVFICQTGKRSLYAAQLLQNALPNVKTIFHVDGGIKALEQHIYG